MGTATATIARVGTGPQLSYKVTWTLTQANPNGEPISTANIPSLDLFNDLCAHATGTWDSATVGIHGSNNDSVYGVLNNAFTGTALTWTADGSPKQVGERPIYYKPVSTGGGATQSVVVVLNIRRNMGAY